MALDFDRELSKVGEWGHYQRLVLYCLLVPATLPCAFQAYNQLFMAATPDHWCGGPAHLMGDIAPHLPQHTVKHLSIPYDNSTGRYSRCHRYDYNYTQHLQALGQLRQQANGSLSPPALAPPPGAPLTTCGEGGWTYDLPEYTTSVVAQWDLVCDRSFDPTLALVLLGAAGLVGNYIFGYLQDGLGRRPSFFIYLGILCLFGLATAYAPSFNWWLACRVGVGFTIPAVMVTPFVLSIELVGPEQRTFTTVIMNVGYSSGLILLSGVAYLARDWTQLALATTIPFLAFFLAFKAMPESPRWLASRGRITEAQNMLLTIARVNRRNVRPNFLQEAQDKATLLQKSCLDPSEGAAPRSEDRSYGVLDLFRTPNLARKTLIITFIWFTNTSVYVGLSYYAPSLGGDAYLNFFLAGVSELPTYLFLWPSMEYWGRRWTLCTAMIIGGTACIATVCTQDSPTTTLVLYCVGKFGISSSFVVLPLMASELYPTVVRGVGLSLSAVAGMIGPIVVPLINHLGAEMMVLPLMIMGVLLVLGALFSLLLPETLHQALPNTLLEGELFGKSLTSRDYCNCCPRRRAAKTNASVKKEEEFYKLADPASNVAKVEPLLLSRTTNDGRSSLLTQLPCKRDIENYDRDFSEKTRHRGDQTKDIDEDENLIQKPNTVSIV